MHHLEPPSRPPATVTVFPTLGVPFLEPEKQPSLWAVCHPPLHLGAWQAQHHLSRAGGSGGCWHLATRDPQKPFQCRRLETGRQSQVLRPVWQWQRPKELGRGGLFSKSSGLCSLPLLSRIVGETEASWWSMEWEDSAWPPEGQRRFMGLDFYWLGRGPRQEPWSLPEATHA